MGVKIWCFKVLVLVLGVARVDTLALLPLAVTGVILLVVGGTSGAGQGRRAALCACGGALLTLFAWAVRWSRRSPVVPDAADVGQASLSDPEALPRAPAAPLADDLLALHSEWFRDREGRRVLLRGVNVSGLCKKPCVAGLGSRAPLRASSGAAGGRSRSSQGNGKGEGEGEGEGEDEGEAVAVGGGPAEAGRASRSKVRASRAAGTAGDAAAAAGQALSGKALVSAGISSASHRHVSELEAPAEVSFVGRPFPLAEADEHFARLRAWGMTTLRLLVTWEAVEHAGPGQYDQAYLDYLVALVRRARPFGISVFIDMHQDVWSRWSGGDGAPAWTLTAVGFDLATLNASAAAVTEQHNIRERSGERAGLPSPTSYPSLPSLSSLSSPSHAAPARGAAEPQADVMPPMVWNSNNARLAAGTMWTLFFAGNDFAPATLIEGVPAQEWLQARFCDALGAVAHALREEPNVLGFDVLNEPSVGFVGVRDVADISDNQFYVGWRVSAWDAMRLGAGLTLEVDFFSSFLHYAGKRTLNTTGAVAWAAGADCVWRDNGVWDWVQDHAGKMEMKLMRPHHFSARPDTGEPVDFLRDYAVPFWWRAAQAVRQHMPRAFVFLQPVLDMSAPNANSHPVLPPEVVGPGAVWARHWYDGLTLMGKDASRFLGLDTLRGLPLVGESLIEWGYGRSLAAVRKEAAGAQSGPACPVLIGETGIPFDMGDRAHLARGDFAKCTMALNRTMRAMERAMLSLTLWNYTPDNTNELGDDWNGEDLSLFSRSQQAQGPASPDDVFAGGRALHAAIRPYPCRIAGEPVCFSFDPYRRDRHFYLSFVPDHTISSAETDIFLPVFHYPHGADVTVEPSGAGTFSLDPAQQTLTYRHSRDARFANCRHTITVRKRQRGSAPAREPEAQAKGAPPRDRLCASARCCRCFAPGAAVSSPTAVDPLVPAAGYEQAETSRGAPPSTRGPWSLALARQAGLEAKLREMEQHSDKSPAVLPEEP
jgi:hypothetical protein